MKIMIIYEGTNILVSGAFLKCFSIVKLGFTGVYIFFIFALKHRLWVLVRTNGAVQTYTHNLYFE